MGFQNVCRRLALPLALIMALVSGPLTAAQAAMISTDTVIAEEAAASDRAKVLQFMAREDVRGQMRALGVDPDEAVERTRALSDPEIARIAGRLDEAPAGQNGLGTVIGAAVLIFLVLLITDILCLTSVFSFTHCVRSNK